MLRPIVFVDQKNQDMYTFVRSLILGLSAFLFFQSCQSQADNAEVIPVATHSFQMEINGMTCESGCKKLIEKKMIKHPGVLEFSIDFETAVAHVVFDGTISDTTDLVQAVSEINQGAYSAEGISSSYQVL
jgi:copper chaperone CopZ